MQVRGYAGLPSCCPSPPACQPPSCRAPSPAAAPPAPPAWPLPAHREAVLLNALQAGSAARAAYGQDPASRYMPHLSLLYSDIPEEERCAVGKGVLARLWESVCRSLAGLRTLRAKCLRLATANMLLPCLTSPEQTTHCGRGAAAAVWGRRQPGAAARRGDRL